MSLDFPASGEALWSLYDAGGPRPEYVLPCLWAESGFNPSSINSIGCAGVNQSCSDRLASVGVDAATFASWPASQQISTGVRGQMLDAVNRFGPLKSATRAYQANFLPATLPLRSLDSVLTRFPAQAYTANSDFDTAHKGFINLADLAKAIRKAVAQPAVKSAIAATYELRASEHASRDPVLGDDFGGGGLGSVAVFASLAFLFYAWRRA